MLKRKREKEAELREKIIGGAARIESGTDVYPILDGKISIVRTLEKLEIWKTADDPHGVSRRTYLAIDHLDDGGHEHVTYSEYPTPLDGNPDTVVANPYFENSIYNLGIKALKLVDRCIASTLDTGVLGEVQLPHDDRETSAHT